MAHLNNPADAQFSQVEQFSFFAVDMCEVRCDPNTHGKDRVMEGDAVRGNNKHLWRRRRQTDAVKADPAGVSAKMGKDGVLFGTEERLAAIAVWVDRETTRHQAMAC